jgi:hypothetical protein
MSRHPLRAREYLGHMLEPVINFASVSAMESAHILHSYRDSEGSRDCIPCHISQKVRFSRVLSSRAILALLKVHNRL